MSSQSREVPLSYPDLVDAVHGGVFPAERHWLDFKRELYPRHTTSDAPRKPKANREIYEELACDMASLAVRGGYLIFGVEENKANHTFKVVDMPLPAHLEQTIDQVARDRITPPLSVVPHLLPNPASPGHDGMMVIEVLESPDAPHMVSGTYYGRSETGKIRLPDDEVERLVLRRGRADDRLRAAMATTVRVDPEPDTEPAHFYFTAVPSQGWPEMLLDYTRDPQARQRFLSTATNLHNIGRQEDAGRDESLCSVAFGNLIDFRRGQDPRGAWFYNYPLSPLEDRRGTPRRALGLEDDGTVRFIDLSAGSQRDGLPQAAAELRDQGQPVSSWDQHGYILYDMRVWWETLDLIRLVGAITKSRNYHGNWLLGAELGRMDGRRSGVSFASACDTDWLTKTIRATRTQVLNGPRDVATGLLRPLFRDLGSETQLDEWTGAPASVR